MKNTKLCKKKACNKLNKAMHGVCDTARSCKGGDPCMVIVKKAAHLYSCLGMRYAVQLCHGRNNDLRSKGDQQAIQQIKNRVKKCSRLLKSCCF